MDIVFALVICLACKLVLFVEQNRNRRKTKKRRTTFGHSLFGNLYHGLLFYLR